mmetsp:Transcript_25758/g.35390  ORF Transcript_25758/g.35390 Transcript_25758/m.35390 type:complete len:87 (-) Transcript_25758:588-848(-)
MISNGILFDSLLESCLYSHNSELNSQPNDPHQCVDSMTKGTIKPIHFFAININLEEKYLIPFRSRFHTKSNICMWIDCVNKEQYQP